MPSARGGKFKRLVGSVSSMVADSIHRGKSHWVAIIEETILVEANSKRALPSHIQFEHFTSDNAEKLEAAVNKFCSQNEVSKIDYLWHDHEPGTWTIIVRYHVA